MAYWHHYHRAKNMSDPCEYQMLTKQDTLALDKTGKPRLCGAPWSSSLHPPDQYRHWCAVLAAGGDCNHEED
jgi:hypothetical protein